MIFSKCAGRDKRRYAEYCNALGYYATRYAGASPCFPAQAERGSSSQPFTHNPSRDNVSQTFLLVDPYSLQKVTTDLHILAYVNTVSG